MKILVVGSGGREHAILAKLAQSPRKPALFVAPGNGGTASLATNVNIDSNEIDRLLDFAQKEKIDLTIVGPEDPLCAGIVDRFEAAGLRIFGPRAAAARLEGSKAFAKQLMKDASVPTADARIFEPTDQEREARRLVARDRTMGQRTRLFEGTTLCFPVLGPRPMLAESPTRIAIAYELARDYVATREAGLVIKASGLAKGKGAFVCHEPAEAIVFLEKLMVDRILGEAGDAVVVEERFIGMEMSVLALVDGKSIYILEPACDYKRLKDDDEGPNTGGMGEYCPPPEFTEALATQVASEVFVPVVDALKREGIQYKGVLFAGLMLSPGGPKVLEFNCRFGDPETQPILARLKTDLIDVFEAVIDERLDELTIEWDPRPSVCVVVASGGYPDSARNGVPIVGLDAAAKIPGVQVLHAGTRLTGGRCVTAGGRILGITAIADSFADARKQVYEAISKISFEGMQYRKDIALRVE